MEDLEEDESDIEDTAEWGGSYWGAPGSGSADGGSQGARARGAGSDSEEDGEDGDDDDDGETSCCRPLFGTVVGISPLTRDVLNG